MALQKRLVQGIKKAFRRVGLDIRIASEIDDFYSRLLVGLRHHRIDTLLDIGANEGQFALGLINSGYCGRLISFEPMATAHARLCQLAASHAGWEIAEAVALGAEPGEAEINVSANSVSSSLLPIEDSHLKTAPQSAYVGTEMVRVMRLDDIAANYVHAKERLFLKIDTQGFESQVLGGAQQTLTRCTGVLLEMSLVELYSGQTLWEEVWAWLRAAGFEPWAIDRSFSDPTNGRTLQCDVTFFRM